MKGFFKISIFSIFLPLALRAQVDSADLAITKCQAGEVRQAKEIIDLVVKSPNYSKEARTFVYQAFIYKELSKKEQSRVWELRRQAINALDVATNLDNNKEYESDIKQQLKFLLSLFYNEAVNSISSEQLNKSLEFFNVFASNFNKVDTNFNKNLKEVEFLLGVATKLTQEYEKDWKKNTLLIEKIEEIYNRVLKIDPNNYTANYNMGMLFYNHAVHIINDMDYDLDLVTLNDIEDKTIALFKKALPFELAADKILPNRKETLVALQGIYFSLNDFEKSNYYKEQVEKLSK